MRRSKFIFEGAFEMEQEISGWLNSFRIEENVQRAIEMLTHPERLEPGEFLSLINFVYASGFDNELITLLPTLLRRAPILPWRIYLHLFRRQKIKLSEADMQMFMDGLSAQKALNLVAMDPACLKVLPPLESHRQKMLTLLEHKTEERRSELWDKLQFFRSQRMHDEEKRTLKKLRIEFPDDPKIKNEEQNLKELRAREVLSQPRGLDLETLEHMKAPISADEAKTLNAVFFLAEKRIAKTPTLCESFALFFVFLDHPSMAVRLLEKRKVSRSSDWLFAETLFLANLHLQCLEQLDTISVRYEADAETTFAALYLKAQCMWHLGEKEKALEMIRGLIRVRPLYRSAPALLQAWELNHL